LAFSRAVTGPCSTHADAVSANTPIASFSARDGRPSSASSERMCSRPPGIAVIFTRRAPNTSTAHAIGSSSSVTGSPISSHPPQLSFTPRSPRNPTRIPFGGEPVTVANPPMLHAHASPISRLAANRWVFGDSGSPPAPSPPASVAMLTTIGSIITAVAVFDTNALSIAAAIITPATIRFGPTPTRRITCSASRLCAPHRSSVAPSISPPMNRKMTGSAYGAAASRSRLMPSGWNSTIGTSAVAASGIASVIHHTAISTVTAASRRAGSSIDAPASPRYAATASVGPSHTPTAATRPGFDPVDSLIGAS
jgi:hypothetical protein